MKNTIAIHAQKYWVSALCKKGACIIKWIMWANFDERTQSYRSYSKLYDVGTTSDRVIQLQRMTFEKNEVLAKKQWEDAAVIMCR